MVKDRTSLLECDDLLRAATAAEMVFALCERAANRGMEGEELQEYCVFVGAAVNAIVAELPEYVRPSNISCDVIRLSECCRGSRDIARTGKLGGGMGGGH